MKSQRVTIADVARKAGVSRSAAAYALKNDPNASRATCERVQRVARELGYRADPMLARLMSHLHFGRARRYVGKLAFLNPDPDANYQDTTPALCDWMRGATARARMLGYEIERFWMQEPGVSPRRLAQILHARGIEGILLGALEDAGAAPAMPWENFSVVTIGYSVREPAVPRVVTHHYRNTCLALREIEVRGYRRPGLLAFRPQEEAMDNLHLAAFCAYRDDSSAPLRASPLVTGRMDAATLRAWFERERPDVILTPSYPANVHFQAAGLRVPDDVALVSLIHHGDEKGIAGVRPGNAYLGAVAVDLLVSQIHHRDTAASVQAQIVQIDGTWQAGRSLPRRR